MDAGHFLIVMTVLLLTSAQVFAAMTQSSAPVPGNLDVPRHFSFHGSRTTPGMWQALRDKDNGPILSRCVRGATNEELAALNIPDLTQRLERLQKVDLIRQAGETYTLAFPAVVGQTRHELQQKVHAAAAELLPTVTSMIQEVKGSLGGREEMTFHVLWSVILDGSEAWQNVAAELAQEQPDADAATIGQSTRWLIYPSHPNHVGTHSDSTAQGYVSVTWLPKGPDTNHLLDLVRAAQEKLIVAGRSNQPVQGLSEAVAAELGKFGFVTESGHSRLCVIDAAGPDYAAYRRMGASFGRQAVQSLDVPAIASLLGATPGLATDMTYHQLCYEILRLCASSGQLEIPKVSDSKPEQAYRLVSILAIEPWSDPFLKSEMGEEERQAIARYEEIRQRIVAGEAYESEDTPVDALLTFLAAMRGDKLRLRIVRVPPWPTPASKGDVHGIYSKMEGEADVSDIQLFVFRGGQWRREGNAGRTNVDWRAMRRQDPDKAP